LRASAACAVCKPQRARRPSAIPQHARSFRASFLLVVVDGLFAVAYYLLNI
jgi:hypothetical protein